MQASASGITKKTKEDKAMYKRIAVIIEVLLLLAVLGLIYYLTSSFSDFKPSSLAENAESFSERIKSFFGGGTE